MKPLNNVGPVLNHNIVEPASSGESSPCHSDHGKELQRRKRKKDLSLNEFGKMILDSSLVAEKVDKEPEKGINPTILLHGLSDDYVRRNVLNYARNKLGTKAFKARYVIYKSKLGILLYFRLHAYAETMFKMLNNDTEITENYKGFF